MDPLPEQPLAPLYYRDNFQRLCNTVRGQYDDILTAQEHEFLDRFDQLSLPAQCLYVRLISRTGPWFRFGKLEYAEIPGLPTAMEELLAAQLAMEAQQLGLEELGRLYTRPELEQLFATRVEGPRPATKSALLQLIEALGMSADELLQQCQEQHAERIVQPAGADHVALLQVLFFGNRHQSLTQFVLEDLGVTRFFPYKLHPEHRFFSCRDAVEEYLACAAIADSRYALLENDEMEALLDLALEVLNLEIQFPSTRARWDKLCNRLGRDLERLEEWEVALALYARSESHPARERSARILERTGQLQPARQLCEEILRDPLNEAEQEAAEKILPRVIRKLEGTRIPRQRDTFEEIQLVVAPGDTSVELCAANHLASDWRAVHYVENSLMNALFGLAFWDIIFADEPGVFHHPFQGAPADMYDGSFSRRRKGAIAARLRELAGADLRDTLCATYSAVQAYQNRWIDWRYISQALIEDATAVIPNSHLLAIWERILFDPRENRRGFPDLVALGQARGEYALIEVKGPGDTLQDNQKRWLRYFQAQAIPAMVAWVSWAQAGDSDA